MPNEISQTSILPEIIPWSARSPGMLKANCDTVAAVVFKDTNGLIVDGDTKKLKVSSALQGE